MKIILTFIAIILFACKSHTQVKSDDFGRIILNTYVSQELKIPEEAKRALETKLNQISTNNGIGGSSANPRFILTAAVNIGTKDIIAGPPQMIAQNLDITLYVGDAVANTKFSNITLPVKGVGTNENKALIDAFKNINPRNKEIALFLEEGKSKIISYYSSQCDIILKQANSLSGQYKYEEAIYTLMSVPETCKDCYLKSREEASRIFNKKIQSDCVEKVKQAKILWAAEPDNIGAAKVVNILISIIPSESCKMEIDNLSNEINKKLQEDQKKKYEYEIGRAHV
mgnify:CR=1 FL=1